MSPELRAAVAKYFDELASHLRLRAQLALEAGVLLEPWSRRAREASAFAASTRGGA